MNDPRETAVETLLLVRQLLAMADHDPETPAGAAIEQALTEIAVCLGTMPEAETVEVPV
jgi:hypothetical protein